MLPSPRAVARHLDLTLPWRGVPTDGVAAGYHRCGEIARRHSRSFYFAGWLLPPERRRAMFGLYAFCRTCDDIVDRGHGDTAANLAAWRVAFSAADLDTADPVLRVWADLQSRYRLDATHVDELIEGVTWDLTPERRYATLDDLLAYCYRVASTVGLLSLPLLGWVGSERPRGAATALGQAMQLTNILRDIGEDAALGRCYLPRTLCERHGLTEAEVRAGVVTPPLVDVIEALIAEAERLYQQAWIGIGQLAPESRFGIAVALVLYRAILPGIRRIDYDVFRRRAHTSLTQKLWLTRSTRRWLTEGALPPLPVGHV